MSDTGEQNFERRLRDLERSSLGTAGGATVRRPNPVVAVVGILAICGLGAFAYLALQEEEEIPLPTARPDEFQTDGSEFGDIERFVPPPTPEPEVVIVERPPVEPNAELLARIAELQAEIEAIRNAPEPVVEEDTAAAEAIEALTAQIAGLQTSSEEAQRAFKDELAARDQELKQLRMDLELAQLEAPTPAPLPPGGPTAEELLEIDRQRRLDLEEAERLRRHREAEAARVAELERRRQEAAAFERARILSPTIAFGGAGAGQTDGALADRTFGEVTDFVLNGALPVQVTQAEVIANPSSTVVQGTMIQAVTETALDSSLPGQIRAIISEDVHAFDGSRVLIPRGSRLIGRYRSGIDVAQRRVTIAWDRIVLPSNQTVVISSFGGDELGRSGVGGFVDTRFDERFGSAALISLISAAPGAAAGQVNDDDAADVLEDVGDDLADSTDSVIGEYLSIGPVIYVDQGSRITVMVDRDLEIF